LFSFAATSALIGLLVILPARAWWGDESALTGAVALAICLLPALGTLAWVQWSWGRPIETQFTAGLGGTAVRLVAVAFVTLFLGESVPFLAAHGLVSWVLFFYLTTLALEVGLLLWAWPTAVRPSQPSSVTPPPPAEAAKATGASSIHAD
jgi:hypothetical protein